MDLPAVAGVCQEQKLWVPAQGQSALDRVLVDELAALHMCLGNRAGGWKGGERLGVGKMGTNNVDETVF